jgi:nucleotide-binding universal stress UspA family protein
VDGVTRTVLVACDGDDQAPLAFADVVAPLLAAPVTLVSVRATSDRAGGETDSSSRIVAGARVELAASAAAGLRRVMLAEAPVLTVLGSSFGAPLGRVRLGTTGERVLHGAAGPVVVVPRGVGARPLNAIAVGLLPTADSLQALELAVSLAAAAAVGLLVLTVLPRSPSAHDAAAFASAVAPACTPSGPPAVILRSAIMAAVADAAPPFALSPAARSAAAPPASVARAPRATEAPPVEPMVLIGDAVDALLRTSRRVGLLVLGSRAYGPPGLVAPGGVARRVLADARCPVLLSPRAQAPAHAVVA